MEQNKEGTILIDELDENTFSHLSPRIIYVIELNLLSEMTVFRFDLREIDRRESLYLNGWRWISNHKKKEASLPYNSSRVNEYLFFNTKEDAMQYALVLVMKGHKPPKVFDLPAKPKVTKRISPSEYYASNPNKRKTKK